jgi:2'-5' RNA ligase
MRLFVSIDPPAEIADELARRAALAGWAGARLTPADHIHLTAHFIGEVGVRELPRTLESVDRAAAGLGPFTLTLTGLATFPGEGPPRLVAAVADRPPQLLELHRRLVHRLARRPREADRFEPHLTLARFTRPPEGSLTLPAFPGPLAFRVDHAAVKESVLRPGGAEHRPLRLVGLS